VFSHTEHPEFWQAVDIQVPLLDRLRFEQLAAWVSETAPSQIRSRPPFWRGFRTTTPGVPAPVPAGATTTKDDCVGPRHARKFAARLAEYGIPCLTFEGGATARAPI
jgi:prolyl oligopeptidase